VTKSVSCAKRCAVVPAMSRAAVSAVVPKVAARVQIAVLPLTVARVPNGGQGPTVVPVPGLGRMAIVVPAGAEVRGVRGVARAVKDVARVARDDRATGVVPREIVRMVPLVRRKVDLPGRGLAARRRFFRPGWRRPICRQKPIGLPWKS